MSWQIALLLNLVFSATRTCIQKNVLKSLNPFVFLFYASCVAGIIYFTAYLVMNRHLPPIYPEMFLLGMIFGLSTTSLFYAISVNLSQTSLLGTYKYIIPVILAAVFIGESSVLNLKTVSGILLGTLALYLLTGNKTSREKATNNSFVFIILSYIIFDGLGQFWNKVFLANHNPLETLISQVIGGIPFLFIAGKMKQLSFRINRNQMKWILADSFAEVGFAVFLLLSFKLGSLSLVLPVQTLGITISGTLLGLFIFKEIRNFNRRKLIGMLIGLVGITLLVF